VILVLAVGNPLREDDGVAWHVASALREAGDAVEVATAHQLMPEMAETVARAKGVVFVDACEGRAPGSVWCETVRGAATTAGFTHSLDPATLLALAERVYGGAPPAALVSIGGERFGHGDGLSARVSASLPSALRWVRRIAADWTRSR
jgi:hydrogenase maturation protease